MLSCPVFGLILLVCFLSCTETKCLAGRTFRPDGANIFRKIAGFKYTGYDDLNKTESFISNSYSAVIFNGIHYYWDRKYYEAVSRELLETTCVEKIFPNDPSFGDIYFEDGTRLKEIVYGCPRSLSCCDFNCCTMPLKPLDPGAILLVVGIMILIMALICILLTVEGKAWNTRIRHAGSPQPEFVIFPTPSWSERRTECSRTEVPPPSARQPIPLFISIPIDPIPRVNPKSRILPPPKYDELEASNLDRPPSYEDVPQEESNN